MGWTIAIPSIIFVLVLVGLFAFWRRDFALDRESNTIGARHSETSCITSDLLGDGDG